MNNDRTTPAWFRLTAIICVSIALGAVAYAAQVVDNLTILGPATTFGKAIAGHNTVDYSPANPTGNGTSTYKMQGIGADAAAVAFTPVVTGNALFIISGSETSGTATDGGNIKCVYGTGTAPANAATATGTQFGNVSSYVGGTTTNPTTAFSVQGEVTGLTKGTAYWLDCQTQNQTGGTFSLSNVHVTAIEN